MAPFCEDEAATKPRVEGMEKSDVELACEVGADFGADAGRELRSLVQIGTLTRLELLPAALQMARAVERSIRVGAAEPPPEAKAYAAAYRSSILEQCSYEGH